MHARVLGSAAGGGFPQWNCGCNNCEGVRTGTVPAHARTQESLAFSADADHWFLINASPEIRGQIERCTELHPKQRRHTPIEGIFLTNGDLDHCLGLLSLREDQPLQLYATEAVRQGFVDNNVLYRTLQRSPAHVTWHELRLHVTQPLLLADGSATGLSVTALPVPGKVPLHLEPSVSPSPGDNIALSICDGRRRETWLYAPGVASLSSELASAMYAADVVMFDGTFWSDDELVADGLGYKHASEMAHWPVGGSAGSLAVLRALPAKRKLLTHINNTNPVLIESSSQYSQLQSAGVELARDGMQIELQMADEQVTKELAS